MQPPWRQKTTMDSDESSEDPVDHLVNFTPPPWQVAPIAKKMPSRSRILHPRSAPLVLPTTVRGSIAKQLPPQSATTAPTTTTPTTTATAHAIEDSISKNYPVAETDAYMPYGLPDNGDDDVVDDGEGTRSHAGFIE